MRLCPLAIVLTLATAAVAQTAPPSAPPMAPTPLMPPAALPATVPTSQPEDVAAIQATLIQYNAAVTAGDVAALQGFVAVSTELQKKAMALMGRLTTSGQSVYKAAVEKFGEAELVKNNVERQSFPAGYPALPADMLDIRPSGDKASLINRLAAEAPPLAMKRDGGQWKIDGDALLPAITEKQLDEQSAVLDAAIGAIDQTAADTRAGHFRAPDEVVILMNHRVQKAVRLAQAKMAPMVDPAMPGGPGPAGPVGPRPVPPQ